MPSEATEAAVQAPEAGTPAAEPPEQPAAPPPTDQAPAKPTNTDAELRSLRAEFTRRTQAWAAARRELGLDADASNDDFLSALRAVRQRADVPGDSGVVDPEITDPRYVDLERRAREQLWRAQEVVHGPVAVAAKELAAFASRTADPEALTEKMYELLGRFAAPEAPAPAPPAGEAAPPAAPDEAPSFGLMDSGTRMGGTVGPTPEVTDEFRNTGNVEGWLGRLLRRPA